MSKHAPGPWTIDDNSVIGTDGYAIADLSDERGPIYRVDGERRKVGPKSLAYLNANLRLIAAAPDLLTVLWDIVRYAGDTGWNPDGIADAARAAIAKAEGK